MSFRGTNRRLPVKGVSLRSVPIRLLLVLLLGGCSLARPMPVESPPEVPAERPAPEIQKPPPPCPKVDYLFPAAAVRDPRLHVCKAKRRLLVFDGDILIRDYPVGLGPFPVGDKFVRGDGRTPEGQFFVCVKNSQSRYYKSLGVSYPSPAHAERALLSGRLSLAEYRAIREAAETNQRPPWNTCLGGAICIHGGGAQEDWTEGCISLNNDDIDELFEMVSVGTPVFIRP